MTATKPSYEVNANGSRTYSSPSAAKVASVATAWRLQGHDPKAYAVIDDGMVRCVEVPISTVAETKAALRIASCLHDWHRGSVVNGVEVEDCQLCGATR